MTNPLGFMPYKRLRRRAFLLWLIFFCIFFFGFGALLGDYMLIYVKPRPENKVLYYDMGRDGSGKYSQMNDYDKMRVDRCAADLFAKYMQHPDGFMPYAVLKRRYFKYWLILFISFLLSAYVFIGIEGAYSICNIICALALRY